MTIKQKFERIDQSKLEPNQVNALKIVVDFTENFKTKDKEKIKITNDKLDTIIGKLQEKNPDALKPAPSAKKAGTAKKTSSTKTPKRNVFSVAKEIKKAGETFEEAKVRASKVIKQEKEEANKIVKTEMQKLQEYIKEHKELQGISGTDLGRDAVRVAKVGGRRISKNGNIYYENRENRKDRLAPNYPKYAPLLANGGAVSEDLFENYEKQPKKLAEIVDFYMNKFEEGDYDYQDSQNFLKEVEAIGYTFDYGLDNEPYGLRPIGTKLKEYAKGGEFMTDPTFGNFQNQVYAKGGLLTPRERYILEIKGLSGVRATAIEDYIEDNGLSNDDVLNIVIGLGRRQLKGTDVSTAIVGKKGNSESKKLIAFAKGNEALKMELGGVMATDLAGHTGGSFGTNTPTPLSGYSGTHYTGLVGETGAMSAGEMFEAGGTLSDPTFLNAYSGTRYTGLVAETGALSSGELFEMGGGLPEGNLDSKDFIKNKKYFNSVEGGIYTFSNKDESGRLHFKDSKNNDRIFSSKKMYEVKSKLEMGGGLPNGVQQSYVNYYLGATGILAEGGSLEAHGIEEGDTFIKTIAGNIQKVKDKDGKIVFINLSTGERDSQPPLPFKKGGSVDYKYLNHNQDYEVRYAKGKNRHGYGHIEYAKGGETEFSEKRKDYLENLGNLEAEVWDKIGAISGGQIRGDKTLLKKYAEGVAKIMETEGVGYGSFDQQDYDFYTDENLHLFNEFLVWNNYYEPEITKVQKAWRLEYFKNPKNSMYVSNPKVITLNSTKRTNEQEVSFSIFEKIINESKSEEDAFNKAREVKGIPLEVSKSFMEKYDPNRELTPRQSFSKFYKEVKANASQAPIAKLIPNLKKYYVSHDNIESVTVKKGGKEVTYDAKDVLNGANMLEKGGQLEKIANYISKNNVVDVELKDGTTVKPSNGYWIKKGANPIDKMEKGGKVEEAIINKDGIRVRSVAQPKKKLTEAEWLAKHSESKEARTYKAGGDLSKYSEFIQDEFASSKKLANKFAKKYNLPFLVLVEKDNDDEIYVKEANGFYAFPKSYIDAHDVLYVTADKMAEGGVTFDEKSSSIAKKFVGKAVEPKYQKEYGKVYSKSEAKEVGDKIAGSMVAKVKMAKGGDVLPPSKTYGENIYEAMNKFKISDSEARKKYGQYTINQWNDLLGKKMAKGGVTSRGGIMLLAKQIRKENESWKDALKRAGEQLRK